MVNAACGIGLLDEQLNVFMDVGHNISAIVILLTFIIFFIQLGKSH